MTRKGMGFTILLFGLAIGSAGGVALWSLRQVPDFYREALRQAPAPEVQRRAAKTFVENTRRLAEEIKHSDTWSEEFSQQQVNSWLAEELEQKYPELVPPGVSAPRVQFSEDNVQIGFRFQQDQFDGIVSVRLKPTVLEPNQLAIEIEWLKAGAVPIPVETVFQQFAARFEIEGWRVECEQSDGHHVVVVHVDPESAEKPLLEAVNVVDGSLIISGRRAVEPEAAEVSITAPRPTGAESAETAVAEPSAADSGNDTRNPVRLVDQDERK